MSSGTPVTTSSSRNDSDRSRDGRSMLPLRFASRLAGLDLGAVMAGESSVGGCNLNRRPLRLAECAHRIGATQLRDPAGDFEEPDDAFEGVLPVDDRGEPPDAPTQSAQDHPEAPQHRTEPDAL